MQDIATPKFSMPSPVRTVIAADFDNDQELEVFFNNIAYRGSSANRLFRLGAGSLHPALGVEQPSQHSQAHRAPPQQCHGSGSAHKRRRD